VTFEFSRQSFKKYDESELSGCRSRNLQKTKIRPSFKT